MKNVLLLGILIIFQISANAQTRRMNNIEVARTYSAENQIETTLPLLLQAQRQFQLLDYQGTINSLDNAIAQNPNSAEALSLRARILKTVGREKEGEMDLRRANQINPYAAFLYGYYGNLGVLEVLYITPEDSLQTDISLNDQIDAAPRDAMLRIKRGNDHLLYGRHLKAIDDYTKAIQLDGNNGAAYYNRGITFFTTFDKVSGCADLDKSIELGHEAAKEMKRYFCTW